MNRKVQTHGIGTTAGFGSAGGRGRARQSMDQGEREEGWVNGLPEKPNGSVRAWTARGSGTVQQLEMRRGMLQCTGCLGKKRAGFLLANRPKNETFGPVDLPKIMITLLEGLYYFKSTGIIDKDHCLFQARIVTDGSGHVGLECRKRRIQTGPNN